MSGNFPVSVEKVKAITNKGGDIRLLISPTTVGAKKLIMGIASLQPNEVLIEHAHDYGEEAFYVKSGLCSVFLDNDETSLKTGDAVIIPQGCCHKVVNTGTEPLELVFVAAPLAPTTAAGDRIIKT